LEPSWSTMPLPMDFFQACRDAFSGAIFDAPGWAQQQIACTYSGEGKAEVTTSWARQMGQIHLLRMMRPDNHAATPILLDRNGDRATMSFQIETPARDEAVDAFGAAMLQPWPADVVERRILERFQVM